MAEPQGSLDALLRASASGALERCAAPQRFTSFGVADARRCAASPLMPTPFSSPTARAFRETRCSPQASTSRTA